MPHRCCVATCKGNCDTGQKVVVFGIPKEEELKKQWLWNIKRDDGFIPTKHSNVCQLHFRPEEILRESQYFDAKSGQGLTAPLIYPRLKKGAIPNIFPDGPSHLSSAAMHRESPQKKRCRREADAIQKAVSLSLLEKENYDANNIFFDLKELKSCLLKETLPCNWTVMHTSDHTIFLNICIDVYPQIAKSLLKDSSLKMSAFVKNIPLKLVDQIPFPSTINDKNILLNVLQKLDSFSQNISEKNGVGHHLHLITLMNIRNSRLVKYDKHNIPIS